MIPWEWWNFETIQDNFSCLGIAFPSSQPAHQWEVRNKPDLTRTSMCRTGGWFGGASSGKCGGGGHQVIHHLLKVNYVELYINVSIVMKGNLPTLFQTIVAGFHPAIQPSRQSSSIPWQNTRNFLRDGACNNKRCRFAHSESCYPGSVVSFLPLGWHQECAVWIVIEDVTAILYIIYIQYVYIYIYIF